MCLFILEEIFTLDLYDFLISISTMIVKLELTILVIHKC